MGITAGIAILIGVVVSWGVAVPLLTVNSVPADGQSLSDLATQLWSSQVRFLGAGTIGVAALWTLATLFKPMVRGVWASLGAVRGNSQASSLRTELDMPAKWILLIAGICWSRCSWSSATSSVPPRRTWPARSSGAWWRYAWCSPSSSAS